MNFLSFKETISYLESDLFIRPSDFESASKDKNPLDRFIYFLSLLDNPHKKFKSVVVSGTSGKGSTTIMIASMLTKAGYKTGQTISPHIETVTERLVINGQQITQNNFVLLINSILSAIEKMKESTFGLPSYFEILLAASFVYFATEKVDIAVVEVGLEGKYDGTNVLDPLAFVLTNISLDHTNILGDTIEKISQEATDRISYLPKKSFVISAVKEDEIKKMVLEKSRESKATCQFLYENFSVVIKKSTKTGSEFNFKNKHIHLQQIKLALVGQYQTENAALAIATILQLKTFGFSVTENQIKSALKDLKIQGRFEVEKKDNQMFILDGAHNSAKMQSFLQEVKKLYPSDKKIFIAGFTTGHDAKNMLLQIAKIADFIVLTQYEATTDLGKNRSVSLTQLQQFIHSQYVFPSASLKDALKKAYAIAKQQRGIIFVTGSLYLVGKTREYLHSEHSLIPTE
ncbi:MAG TPA: Mur ligase family protein [Patescibacteria group bacterium]